MIIAIKKQIQIKDRDLKSITVSHWVVEDVVNRVSQDFATITLAGYTNRQSRLDGEAPVIKNLRLKIENTYDEDGNIVKKNYNKFMRYLSATPDARHKDNLKEAVLEYLRTVTDFMDAIDD